MLKAALLQSLHLVSTWLPLPLLLKLSGQYHLPIFYHVISDVDLPHVKHLYHVRNCQRFEEDLDYLLRYYEPIDLHQLIAAVYQGKPLPKRSFLLTFDDGLAECATVIAPILQRKGIPATFFINADFVDNKALMFRYKASYLIEHLLQQKIHPNTTKELSRIFEAHQLPFQTIKNSFLKVRWEQQAVLDDVADFLAIDFQQFLQKQQPYLNKTQLQDLLDAGFTLGSHSCNHPTYFRLPLEDQIEQTLASQRFLEENFKLSYRVFAFPFTDFGVSAAFFDKILTKANFQLTFGGAGLKQEQIKGQLQRFGLETAVERPARQLIHTEYCYYLLKALLGKNTIRRQ